MYMNKTTFYQKQKVLLVISFTFLILSSFIYLPNNDEYILLNKIIEKIKNNNPNKSIILEKSNNNNYVISVLNQLNTFEKSKNNEKLDSLKNELGIENNEIFNSIFNENEYQYLINQKSNSKWNFDKISGKMNSSNLKNKVNLYVSKPIYTKKADFALIYINNKKTSCIVIYEKKIKGWYEYKILSPLLISAKAKLITN